MKVLIQRVRKASVEVSGDLVGSIQQGLLVFVGVDKDDDEASVQRMVDKVLRYRVFADDSGRMNQSVLDIQGELLLVSQFTLVAETRKGLRPSFSSAASPEQGEALYDHFVNRAKASDLGAERIQTGRFGADMQVALVNDGPVTFMLEL